MAQPGKLCQSSPPSPTPTGTRGSSAALGAGSAPRGPWTGWEPWSMWVGRAQSLEQSPPGLNRHAGASPQQEPPVLYMKTTEERPPLMDCENERWHLAKKKTNDHLVCCFSQSRCQGCFFRTNESLHRSSLRAW